MRKNSVLALFLCSAATVLVAARCSDDDAKSDAPAAGAADAAAEVDAGMDTSAPMDPSDTPMDAVDAGVEDDPLGGTLGGGDDMAAPVEDPSSTGDDTSLDEPTTEPEPAPEAGADM